VPTVPLSAERTLPLPKSSYSYGTLVKVPSSAGFLSEALPRIKIVHGSIDILLREPRSDSVLKTIKDSALDERLRTHARVDTALTALTTLEEGVVDVGGAEARRGMRLSMLIQRLLA
jgi:hypothetical protein